MVTPMMANFCFVLTARTDENILPQPTPSVPANANAHVWGMGLGLRAQDLFSGTLLNGYTATSIRAPRKRQNAMRAKSIYGIRKLG